MKNTKITLGVAAATCLLASPAFAAKTSLDDGALGKVVGKANTYTIGSTSTMSVTNSNDASANIGFGLYQWSDDHSTDTSTHKGANDQSGQSSGVQASITGSVNSLVWGAIGQNALTNGGTTTLTGGEVNMSYGVFAGGGF